MIKVFGKPIRVNKSSQDKRAADVGANLFIGNLDPDVDEKVGVPDPVCVACDIHWEGVWWAEIPVRTFACTWCPTRI